MSDFQTSMKALLQALDAIEVGPWTWRLIGALSATTDAERKRQEERAFEQVRPRLNARWEVAKDRAQAVLAIAEQHGIDTTNDNPFDLLFALTDQQRRERDTLTENVTRCRQWIQAATREIEATWAKKTGH